MDDYQTPLIVCCECSKSITDAKEIGGRHGRTLFISVDLELKKSNITEVTKEILDSLEKEDNICYLPRAVEIGGYICNDCFNKLNKK